MTTAPATSPSGLLSPEQREIHLRALDARAGAQAARDQLLIDTPLAVLNRGLDLSFDDHPAGYIEGWLTVAAAAADRLRGELAAALDQVKGWEL